MPPRLRRHASASAHVKGHRALSVSIADFKAGMEKFAGMFTGQHGLRLVFRGTQAVTDSKTIVVPEVSLLDRPNMTEAEVKEAEDFLMTTRGYIYHEGGHVIFSEFEGPHIPKNGTKRFMLVNALEDCRIENKLGNVYPGAKEALRHMGTWTKERVAAAFKDRGLPDPFVQVTYAVAEIGDDPANYKNSPLWKGLAEPAREVAERHKADVLRARSAGSTADLIKICDTIYDAMKVTEDEEPPASPGPTPPPGAPKTGGSGSSGGTAKKKSTAPEDAAETDEEGGDDATGDADDSKTDESEGEPENPSDTDSEDPPSDSGGSTGDDEAPEPEAGSHGTSKGSPGGSPSMEGGSTDDDFDMDLDDDKAPEEKRETTASEMRKMIESAAKKLASSSEKPYLILSTEWDEIGPPDDPTTPAAYTAARVQIKKELDDVRSAFGPVERQLRSLLQTQARSYHVGGLEDGDIDPTALYKVGMRVPIAMRDSRVFRAEVHSNTLNEVEVALSIDISGSMGSNGKDRLARQTALVFAQALDMVKIPFVIQAWTSKERDHRYGGSLDIVSSLTPTEQELYTRRNGLVIRVIKDFDERWQNVQHRMTHVSADNCNYDGEGVLYAAQTLGRRQAKRKVLFVFCDGLPSAHEEDCRDLVAHLHYVVETTRKSGIELVGIGINSPDAKQFYKPSFVNVNDVSDLPGVAIQELKKILLPGSVR